MATKVLLIEDDGYMSRLYSRMLKLEGCAVEIAGDGLTGYEKAKTYRPDLILLDVMMPKLNGLATLEKLKHDPATKDYPVVMLTNLANDADAEEALRIGAVHYLIKSDYELEEVARILRELLAHIGHTPAKN